ncbi:MAG: ribosome-recycling factor [Candidatus Roizmanbacteria bacterium]|nr:ribosome-recycling factor [Candidatus Roizmanbacteria bacterium]
MAADVLLKQKLSTVVEEARESLGAIRTGRASPALIENISVTTYGGQAVLRVLELATIANEGPQDLLVVPFDHTVLQDIETAIRNSQMGFSVVTQGTQIHVKTPPLTQEQREKYVKLVSKLAEESREKVRKLRDDVRKQVKMQFESKAIGEDEKFREEEMIDKVSREYTQKIEDLKSAKEKEVMTV